MVDREVFARRLAKLEELVRELRGWADVELETFLKDRGGQLQVERALHLAAECALDLANHVIADRGWRTPSTYREAFDVLAEQGVLSGELAGQMKAWAGLRNVLVHLYLDLDHAVIHGIVRSDLGQLEQFAAALDALM